MKICFAAGRVPIMRVRRLVARHLLWFTLLAALLTGTQGVWAQATVHFDLGCRAALTAGGGAQTAPSESVTGIVALGQWVQGTSQSANYGVRAGYLQPRQSGLAAVTALAPAHGAEASTTYLPFISQLGRFVRDCRY